MVAYDVVVLATGAAGLTAAATPAELRSRVLDLDGNVIAARLPRATRWPRHSD